LCVTVVAGCGGNTSIKLELSAPGLTITSLRLDIGWSGKTMHTGFLPPDGSVPKLPGSVLLVLPEIDALVELTVSGTDDQGALLVKTASVQVRPGSITSAAITLEPPLAPDLAVTDLAGPIDLAAETNDLAGVALDLSTIPDLRAPADLAPHDPLVQAGAVATGNATLTATLPGASRAGTLLILAVGFDKDANPNGPNGWLRWVGYSTANSGAIFYLIDNPGGITSAEANVPGAMNSVGQLSEWDTFTVRDVGGWCWNSNQVTSVTCTTSMNTMFDGDLVVAAYSQRLSTAAVTTLAAGNGFVTLGENNASVAQMHFLFTYGLGRPLGVPISETPTSGSAGTWGGAIVAFH
jgi:hypothetical protein